MTYASSSTATSACHLPPRTDPCNPSNASTRMEAGKAVFENDNYKITMGDDNTVTINNKNTGECYQAWGDPHMNIDGKHEFDFWGTTTLALEDGTKVTIETTPWDGNKEMTLSSKVTISNGDYGVQVSGVDTNQKGDLKIDEAQGWGAALDWAVDDGNVLHENACGKGFVAIDDCGKVRQVNQQYINETDLMKGGAQQLTEHAGNAFQAFSGLLGMSFLGGFLSGWAAAQGGERGSEQGQGPAHRGEHHHSPRPQRHPEPLWLNFLRWA